MNLNNVPGCLEAKWRTYLEEHEHRVCQAESSVSVIRSCNSNKVRYRWLLLVGYCPNRVLSRSEQRSIRSHLRQAKQEKEKVYLVVGFVHEPRRIVILPASTALRTKCVRSDKGGIDWDN